MLQVLGAVFLLCLFALSGFHKVTHFAESVNSLIAKIPAWPMPRLCMMVVVGLEIVVPFVIVVHLLTGRLLNTARTSAMLLSVFTILVTLIYHPPKLGKPFMTNLKFFSNMSVLGGLLYLAATLD